MLYSEPAVHTLGQPFYQIAYNLETFALNQPTLNGLEQRAKINLVSQILLNCPDNCLPILESNIQSINTDKTVNQQESFNQVLERGLNVRKLIDKITAENNLTPIAYWLGADFDPGFFDEFRELTNTLVEKNSDAILAVFMRHSNNGLLIHRVSASFKGSPFVQQFNLAEIGCQRRAPALKKRESSVADPLPQNILPKQVLFSPLTNRKNTVASRDETSALAVEKKQEEDTCMDGCFGFLGW